MGMNENHLEIKMYTYMIQIYFEPTQDWMQVNNHNSNQIFYISDNSKC